MKEESKGIALLGFGTIGRGAYSLLRAQRREIRERFGVSYDVRKVLVKHPNKKRLHYPRSPVASNGWWAHLRQAGIGTHRQ